MNIKQNFRIQSSLRVEKFVKIGVTLAITKKMVISGVMYWNIKQVLLIAKVAQKVASLGVGEAGIEVSSKVELSCWVGVLKFIHNH